MAGGHGEHGAGVERFHPALLHSILTSVRRFEPDFYLHLAATYHLDADTILGLFAEIDQLGSGPLAAVLADLRQHPAYGDIMRLAGRNAVVEYCEIMRLSLDGRRGGEARFRQLARQVLPAFIGDSSINILTRKDLVFVEITSSIFARGVRHPFAVCGFYNGALLELAQASNQSPCTVVEVRCHAQSPELTSCLFEVGF